MYKKLTLAVTLSLTMGFAQVSTAFAMPEISNSSATPAEKAANYLDYIGRQAGAGAVFLCLFVCPVIAMPFGYAFHIEENRENLRALQNIRTDAEFFAERVLEARSDMNPKTFYYERIYDVASIKLAPGDKVTKSDFVKIYSDDGSYSVQKQDLAVETAGQEVLILKDASLPSIKINGRPVLSDELVKAHQNARYLIGEEMIPLPAGKSEKEIILNAVELNKLILEKINTSPRLPPQLRYR